jgi:hypothetical protein
MAIIYEVNLKVAQTIAQEYLSWLHDHIREMLQQGGFQAATIYEEIVNEATQCQEFSYIIQYTVASREALQHYFDHHAPAMRQQGLMRFGDQFTATRRILIPLSASGEKK